MKYSDIVVETRIATPLGEISYAATAHGVMVRFPKDRALIDNFKKAFPRARFQPAVLAWLVPGATAERRISAWVDSQSRQHAEAEASAEQAKAALADAPIHSRYVSQDHTSLVVRTRYSDAIVALMRTIPGARFERSITGSGGIWRVPFAAAERVRALVPEINRLGAEADQSADQKQAERRAQWDRERAARDQERAAERAAREQQRSRRQLFPLSQLPPLDRPVRLHGHAVVFTGFGKQFRIGESDPSVWGSQLLGHEGELGCYAYYRDATPAEQQALDDTEQTAASRDQRHHQAATRLRELTTDIEQDGDRSARTQAPEGEILLQRHGHLAAYGGGIRFVAADDGLWLIQGNGADGDDWSLNNLPGAIGWRVPRSAPLEAELRHLATVLAGM